MKKINFNRQWNFSKLKSESFTVTHDTENKEKVLTVDLPYDAMIHEKRNAKTKNGGQTGYYPGGIYLYTKKFFVPKEFQNKQIMIEFAGIQGISKILINHVFAKTSFNDYESEFINLNNFLKYGQENEIEVIVNNSVGQNSRWYSGSGIYRDVFLYLANKTYIPIYGAKLQTVYADQASATVSIDVNLKNLDIKQTAVLKLEIFDSANQQAVAAGSYSVTLDGQSEVHVNQQLNIEHPHLWAPEHPALYVAKVTLVSEKKVLDQEQISFGLRTVKIDANHGFLLNGKSIKLRGTCLHHDNGILGAVCLEDAERRKLKLLKNAGFNAIRGSHFPMSDRSLQICDELGLLVLDELTDVWNQGKNVNDYSNYFHEFWKHDVALMVNKDFNHPSVVMYSTGNEIKEAGTSLGAKINRELTNEFHKLDPTRYVTSAVNAIVAADKQFKNIVTDTLSKGDFVANNKDFAKQTESSKKDINELNGMQSVLVGPLANAIAVNPQITAMLNEYVEANDVVGYNYLTGRYLFEHEHFPNRVILGTETFPADIASAWKIIKQHPHAIGEFTWIGYDYLGEAGVGIFYYNGQQNFQPQYPDRAAYIGDIDLIGNRRPMSYYREIVYGLRQQPYIAVERLNHYGEEPSKTPWMWKDAINSWTWPGFEGKPAIVNVCAAADQVELFLNGKSQGKKAAGEEHDFLAVFKINYEPGELVAVGYKNGTPCGKTTLATIGKPQQLKIAVDKTELKANGEDLAFLMISSVDENGQLNQFDEADVSIETSGPCKLVAFGSANPSCKGNYFDRTWKTFDGRVLAVIRAGSQAGTTNVRVSANGYSDAKIKVKSVSVDEKICGTY